MAKVVWTAEAEVWLEDIFRYIAEDSERAAGRVVERIYERAEGLSQFPRLGYRYENVADREVRVLLFGTTESPTGFDLRRRL